MFCSNGGAVLAWTSTVIPLAQNTHRMEVYTALDNCFHYLTTHISNLDTFDLVQNESMDSIVRDGTSGVTRNELRYPIALLQEDDIQPTLGKGMRDIMEDTVLNTLVIMSDSAYKIDDNTSLTIFVVLLDATRVLLYRSCNLVWQMRSQLERDVEGGPTNPEFNGALLRLPGEPQSFASEELRLEYFRDLIGSDRSGLTIQTATLLVRVWQYHWLLTQKSLRELAVVCNHTIPHNILVSGRYNVSSLSEIFSLSTHLEILDQLTLEYAAGSGLDTIVPINEAYMRDTIRSDLYQTSQQVIAALAEYLQIIAENGNIYLAIEKTDEDIYILDSFLDDPNLSDAAVSRWLIERFLQPLEQQLRTWPLCLIFAREFRETMDAKQIIIQAYRNRALPPMVATSIVMSTETPSVWADVVKKTAAAQRKAAGHLIGLESISADVQMTYSIDTLESALAIVDVFANAAEKEVVADAVNAFADAREYSVRLRASLYKITDAKTANSLEAKEESIPRVSEWVQRGFFGSSIENRDRSAAQIAAGKSLDQVQRRLISLIGNNDDIAAALERFHSKIVKKIDRAAKQLSSYLPAWEGGNEMQKNAARILSRCLREPAAVAREIIAFDVVWIAQVICSTFPEADNACLTMLQQLSSLVMNAPFHLKALLGRDLTAFAAAVSQADQLARSELDQLADIGEATNKIPDSAQGNPWHGWSIFPSEAAIVPPPGDAVSFSETAKDQLLFAGITPAQALANNSIEDGLQRMKLGCFARPNIGLVSGLLQELMLRDGNNIRDPRANLLSYLILEEGWATGMPLNRNQNPIDQVITAGGIATSSIAGGGELQLFTELKRSDWFALLTFAVGMTSAGIASSSLLATCVGNHLTHQSDGHNQPLGDDDPYLTAGMRVLTSEYPESVLPPNVLTRRARNNFGLLLSMRYLQSLPRDKYENPRLNVVTYYAREHPFYFSPTHASARFSLFPEPKQAVNDLSSTISHAVPD